MNQEDAVKGLVCVPEIRSNTCEGCALDRDMCAALAPRKPCSMASRSKDGIMVESTEENIAVNIAWLARIRLGV